MTHFLFSYFSFICSVSVHLYHIQLYSGPPIFYSSLLHPELLCLAPSRSAPCQLPSTHRSPVLGSAVEYDDGDAKAPLTALKSQSVNPYRKHTLSSYNTGSNTQYWPFLASVETAEEELIWEFYETLWCDDFSPFFSFYCFTVFFFLVFEALVACIEVERQMG